MNSKRVVKEAYDKIDPHAQVERQKAVRWIRAEAARWSGNAADGTKGAEHQQKWNKGAQLLNRLANELERGEHRMVKHYEKGKRRDRFDDLTEMEPEPDELREMVDARERVLEEIERPVFDRMNGR